MGFASQRGCRKHVKTKHGWYYYFDKKPTLCSSPFAVNEPHEQGSKIVPCCSTDNDFARSFSQWLHAKKLRRRKISQTIGRFSYESFKVLKVLLQREWRSGRRRAGSNLIDYALGNAQLLTKFVNNLKDKWGIGQSGQISYIASISDLLDFRKFNRPPAVVLQNFSITVVYVKRARKCLAKDMRSNWTSELDIETLESRRSWASLGEVQSVIPFHMERYESVLENCMTCPSSVTPADITFATRFVAAYLFLKVKGCRPMTY